jgi:hypothetical protein
MEYLPMTCPQCGAEGVQNADVALRTSRTGEPGSIPETVTLGPELRERIAEYRADRVAVVQLKERADAGEIEYGEADEAEYDVNERAAELLAAVLGDEQ